MKTAEIRSAFLEYFRANGHTIVKSSSLVPHDDPTLLFTNAGMVQFKRPLLGEEKRDYVRATSCQKCMRAGGKHNDLRNVGRTARHHTFFEMLGNFSFGDYFKKEAIHFGWEFLTRDLNLQKDKLYASVHEGDDSMGIGVDQEAMEEWSRYLPQERILTLPTSENFWAMGDTGPCGPCSEIIIDQGEHMACGPECAPGVCDCDRFLELWNLVFMQFNRKDDGSMEPLPAPSIDTGAGLERIAAVLQGVPTNYDIDLFRQIIDAIEAISGHAHGRDADKDVSIKVIADHGRAATFLICDGVLPSNEGRGYVLRRVIRRAVRHGRLLGVEEPFLDKVADSVIAAMSDTYPELAQNASYIKMALGNEEKSFSATLDRGLAKLQDEVEKLKKDGLRVFPGEVIFKLYDTYGFPIDIVMDTARDLQFQVDESGFEKLMAEQRQRSRAAFKISGVLETSEALKQLSAQGITTTFTGYDRTEDEGVILALLTKNGAVSEVSEGEQVEVVCDKTPFYGEAGGQTGDSGYMSGRNFVLKVENAQKTPGDLIVHLCQVEKGAARVGDQVNLRVDEEKRRATERNHTATHILHHVLRSVLGDHVKQQGSYVGPDRLRFDFSHSEALTPEQLALIERQVNERIVENRDLTTRITDMDTAIAQGAMALFEEKYGDTVRMVSIGDYSSELCGGTHSHHTGDIGLFKIVSESSVAAGVRRIEALTGPTAVQYVQEQERILKETAALLRTAPQDLRDRISKLLAQQKELEKEVERVKAQALSRRFAPSGKEARTVNGIKVLSTKVQVDSPKDLRVMLDNLKAELKSAVIVLGAEGEDGKAMLICGVTSDLTDRFNAGEIIKELAAQVGGRGGGRADMAQGGGPRVDGLPAALENVYTLIRSRGD
ncbi:MAG: alanine--tRNA ligase [Deltaproteobacteria bacterium]|nr:alanine--tRNA ligase [Deltaproteobacteria bacterium]MBW2071182.1 alanine--tRNA ligase [Deltaproteobacteria bacterium]